MTLPCPPSRGRSLTFIKPRASHVPFSEVPMPLRNYSPLLEAAIGVSDRAAAMKLACDLSWDHFGLGNPARPAYSWIGFYDKPTTEPEMILVARRDKPACSPIALHGMCGRCWKDRRPLLIPDIATLGPN